jgi:MarR family 2-MHQ and catechol resistance regulon transcriptional repressor
VNGNPTDKIADSLLALMPVYHKHIIRINTRISGREPARYRMLEVLVRPGPHSLSEIGRVLNISKPYMTVLIDDLMEKGWIKRGYDPDDRRVILVTITPSGKKHLHRASDSAKTCVKTLLAGLDREDTGQLCTSLGHLQKIFGKLT